MWTSGRLGRRSACSLASLFFASLHIGGAAIIAWVTLFLKGAISVVRGCLEERVWCWMARDREWGFSLSMKTPNVVGKFLRNQSLHQNNRVSIIKSQKAITNTELTWKTRKGKNHGEREKTFAVIKVISSRLHWCARVSGFNS